MNVMWQELEAHGIEVSSLSEGTVSLLRDVSTAPTLLIRLIDDLNRLSLDSIDSKALRLIYFRFLKPSSPHDSLILAQDLSLRTQDGVENIPKFSDPNSELREQLAHEASKNLTIIIEAYNLALQEGVLTTPLSVFIASLEKRIKEPNLNFSIFEEPYPWGPRNPTVMASVLTGFQKAIGRATHSPQLSLFTETETAQGLTATADTSSGGGLGDPLIGDPLSRIFPLNSYLGLLPPLLSDSVRQAMLQSLQQPFSILLHLENLNSLATPPSAQSSTDGPALRYFLFSQFKPHNQEHHLELANYWFQRIVRDTNHELKHFVSSSNHTYNSFETNDTPKAVEDELLTKVSYRSFSQFIAAAQLAAKDPKIQLPASNMLAHFVSEIFVFQSELGATSPPLEWTSIEAETIRPIFDGLVLAIEEAPLELIVDIYGSEFFYADPGSPLSLMFSRLIETKMNTIGLEKALPELTQMRWELDQQLLKSSLSHSETQQTGTQGTNTINHCSASFIEQLLGKLH